MTDPEAVHPFSNHFRSQLADVLSRPNQHKKKPTADMQYLETEIDSYSGVEFGQHKAKACCPRPPTPPKPAHRTFTFEKTNPFAKPNSDANTLSLPKYAEVIKPKRRPPVATRPKLFPADKTFPGKYDAVPHEQPEITTDCAVPRINSLPDLSHPIATPDYLSASSWNRSMPSYGKTNQMRTSAVASEKVTATNDKEYCDVLPETPNTNNAQKARASNYDDVYEDVDSTSNASIQQKFQPEPVGNESGSDYTLMCSPVSDISFTYARKSLYENTEMIHTPRSDVFYSNDYENVGTPTFKFGDPNRVGLPNSKGGSQIAAASNDHASPTSSNDDHDSYAYSVQSSMASTTASSFQGVQVCYFPPSPPSEFYQGTTTVERHESVTSGSSKKSISSRSRIPVPIKSKNKDSASLSMAKVPDQQPLPPTPTPSPVVSSKKKARNKNDFKLTPPSPPGNGQVEVTPGKGVTSSAKGAKWYEKLGCIQTDTIQPSEPYGLPGERKRSKSLNREQRRSRFFLPVEPNESDPPNTQRSQLLN